jgi:hypothetical protein
MDKKTSVAGGKLALDECACTFRCMNYHVAAEKEKKKRMSSPPHDDQIVWN